MLVAKHTPRMLVSQAPPPRKTLGAGAPIIRLPIIRRRPPIRRAALVVAATTAAAAVAVVSQAGETLLPTH